MFKSKEQSSCAMRFIFGSFLLCLMTSARFTSTMAFVNNPTVQSKAATTATTATSLSVLLTPPGGNSMVSFSEVLLPTYLGAAFAVLSYQMDKDNQFMVKWVKDAKSDPNGAAIQIATVAGLGLVTIPPVAALHTMATIGKVGATSATATTAATTSSAKASNGLFSLFQAKTTAPVAVATKTTAATKVVAATKTTTAVAATAGGVVAMSSVAIPISLGLATAFVSYQVDKDPDYAVKKLQALLELWRTKVVEREVSTSTTASPASTSSGTLAVGSAASAAVMQPSGGTLAVGSTASAAVMNEVAPAGAGVASVAPVAAAAVEALPVEELTNTVVSTTNAATTSIEEVGVAQEQVASAVATPAVEVKKEELTKVQKALCVVQSLYFPWLPMFIPPKDSKRYKAVKFAQALYLPWLPMFLPKNKQQQEQQPQQA